MPKFVDAQGESWPVEITLPDVRRVRTALDLDLLDLSQEIFSKLLDDPELAIDVLSVVLTPLIRERGLDADGFARRLVGDPLDAATDALLEGLIGFFPSRRRAMLTAALTKTREWMAKTKTHAMETIHSPKMDLVLEQMMKMADAEVDQALAAISGKLRMSGSPSPPSTSNPESPSENLPAESTPS